MVLFNREWVVGIGDREMRPPSYNLRLYADFDIDCVAKERQLRI